MVGVVRAAPPHAVKISATIPVETSMLINLIEGKVEL